MKRLLTILALLGLGAAPSLSDSWWEWFDDYPIGGLAGQGGWEIWYSGGGDAYVAESPMGYGQDCLLVTGSNIVHRLDRSAGKWRLTLEVYVPSGATGAAYVTLMNQYGAPDIDSPSARVRIDADLGIATSELEDLHLPLIRDQHVRLEMVFSLNRDTLGIWYDWQPLSTGLIWSTHIDPDGVLALACVNLYSQSLEGCRFDWIELQEDYLIPGDLNCDGFANAFDIDPFVQCLTTGVPTPPCVDCDNGDINRDGLVNAFDIDPYAICIVNGG